MTKPIVLTPGSIRELPLGVKFQETKKTKIFIPVSHNGGGDVKSGYAVCLAHAFNGCRVQIEEMGGSHADRQCNNMANRFLLTDCDVMAIIDCDTEFTARDVQRALAHIQRGRKAIWGIYPKKSEDCPPCLNTWPEVPIPDEHGLTNVRRAGRGFLFVKREVFEALKEDNGGPSLRFHNHDRTEWAFFRSGAVSGVETAMLGDRDEDGYLIREWISEDWQFCEDLRNYLNIPTLVDTGIVLKHIGSKTYTFPLETLVRTDSNISSWRDIHGWFDYEDLYRRLVAEIPDGGRFVEVGCWLGRSIGAFAEFSMEAEKAIHITAVDTFAGEPANPEHAAILSTYGGSVSKPFEENLKALGIRDIVHICICDSATASEWFPTIADAVFIDADHREEFVARDIAAWWPNVKEGGILCGHDYDEPGVKAAVNKAFGVSAHYSKVETVGRCWLVRKRTVS